MTHGNDMVDLMWVEREPTGQQAVFASVIRYLLYLIPKPLRYPGAHPSRDAAFIFISTTRCSNCSAVSSTAFSVGVSVPVCSLATRFLMRSWCSGEGRKFKTSSGVLPRTANSTSSSNPADVDGRLAMFLEYPGFDAHCEHKNARYLRMHEKLRRGRLRQHEPRLVKRLELIENAE